MVYACAGTPWSFAQATCEATQGFSVKGRPFVSPMTTNAAVAGGIGKPYPPCAGLHCGQETSLPYVVAACTCDGAARPATASTALRRATRRRRFKDAATAHLRQ